MNKITAEIRENDLVISREKNGTIIDYLEVRIDDIPYKETQVLPEVIKKEEKEIQYQIFLLEKIEGKDAQEDQVILVYSTRKYIKYILATRAESYRRLIVRHNRLLHVKLNRSWNPNNLIIICRLIVHICQINPIEIPMHR